MEKERALVNNLEKKQKKFDALLADERAEKERLMLEKDQTDKELREKETKVAEKIPNITKIYNKGRNI